MKTDNKDLGNFSSNLSFLEDNNLLNKKDKILEIGSGKGHMLNIFSREKSFNIVGVERYKEFIDEAKEIFGEELPLKKVEDENLPFKDSTFDKVISFDVLEHIPNTDSHLQEVKRVLKDGGAYCFGIPNRLIDEPFCLITYKNFNYRKPGDHCSLHTYWQIKRRLRRNGFSVKFMNQEQNSKWMQDKVLKFFGNVGLKFFLFLNVNKWPVWLKPTLYIIAEKG